MSTTPQPPAPDDEWWRDAVVYEVYLRSFADGDGDGVGDIAGLRSRLDYLASLGIDALWITPWYPSPGVDGGYDVSDYCDIDPLFGDLTDAERLIVDAHDHGLRVLIDLIPNHTSDEHPWFTGAVAAPGGSPQRDRYWIRPGRGPGGRRPPNNWRSAQGGPAWSPLPSTSEPSRAPDGTDGPHGDWYLHLFSTHQPDLNWTDPSLPEEFDRILRFWFDRGIDGFRIDVAHGIAKHPDLPDLPGLPGSEGSDRIDADDPAPSPDDLAGLSVIDHPHWDRDDLHDVLRRFRTVADSYRGTPQGARCFVAEAWRIRPGGLSRYLRHDELHNAFNFDYLKAPWDGPTLQRAIRSHLDQLADIGASATWVMSSHDLTRHVTRLGSRGADVDATKIDPADADLQLGRARARSALLLSLALPGSAYLYQGEELGLDDVDLPDAARRDPIWHQSHGRNKGRDGRRVPIPWATTGPSLGFGPIPGWLPQPTSWAQLSVEAQTGDSMSMLTFYRTALALRRRLAPQRRGNLEWHDISPDVIAFSYTGGLTCVVNLGNVLLPTSDRGMPIITTSPDSDRLQPDCASWFLR